MTVFWVVALSSLLVYLATWCNNNPEMAVFILATMKTRNVTGRRLFVKYIFLEM